MKLNQVPVSVWAELGQAQSQLVNSFDISLLCIAFIFCLKYIRFPPMIFSLCGMKGADIFLFSQLFTGGPQANKFLFAKGPLVNNLFLSTYYYFPIIIMIFL